MLLYRLDSDKLKTIKVMRTIGYPIITAVHFLQFHSKSARKYLDHSSPHFILGWSNTLALGKYTQGDDKLDQNEEKKESKENEHKFDTSDVESIKIELNSDKIHTFTWISNILWYSYENKYLVVHDLMKGIWILDNKNGDFTFTNEDVWLIDTSAILAAHSITKRFFLAQDDTGMLYLVSVKRKKQKKGKVWGLQQNAKYFINERISSFMSLKRVDVKSLDIYWSTIEGNIYNIKIIDSEMIKFMSKIQYNIMKIDSSSAEEKEEILKIYENKFGNGFNGDLISDFFNFNQNEIKRLLLDIRDENKKENESKSIDFNLLSIKMLFF